jgi:uncharacterized protein with PIN domain
MLGRLARYLRLLGHDVSYPDPCADAGLVAMAQNEGRVLLTRDQGILERLGPAGGNPRVVILRSQVVTQQVAQLAAEGWLQCPGPPRCASCNRTLEHLDAFEARHLVPPYTYAVHSRFMYCRSCNHVLWEGSHLERFRRRISMSHCASGLPPRGPGAGSRSREG